MYPPGDDHPHHAKPGQRIEHKLMPGFPMEIHDAKPCDTDGARSEPHDQYLITDPMGNADWLCAYDVRGMCARCKKNPGIKPGLDPARGLFCEACADRCHEATDFAHICEVCAGPEERYP